jgi:urease accessory protein
MSAAVNAAPSAAVDPGPPTHLTGADASGWSARLALRYRRDGARTVAHDRHEGPLRVLQALYPEGPGICHHVLVHPPGGIVGGDRLDLDLELGAGAHALVTTPGATRFYRSDGRAAQQSARLALGAGARLEWLPLETIAHAGCEAANTVRFELEAGAQLLGWDLLALGLPAADAAFVRGRYRQHLEWPGRWLERATIDAADRVLLDGAAGLAGAQALGTLWFASATPWSDARRDALLDAARTVAVASPLAPRAGATAPQPGLVLLRVLAPQVEPIARVLRAVRAAWRRIAWDLPEEPPRIWRT